MKWLLLPLILVASVCQAATVTLTWDTVEEAEGYRLYARQEGQPYDYTTPIWDGENPPSEVTVADGLVWYFVCRAYLLDDESGDSNEISYFVPLGDPLQTTGFRIESWQEVERQPVYPMFINGSLELLQSIGPNVEVKHVGGGLYIIHKVEE